MTMKATTYSKQGMRTLLATMLAVFALVAACALAPASAFAATGSISLQYSSTETQEGIADLQVNAYRIAAIEGENYVLAPNFASLSELLGWNDGSIAISNDAAWLAEQAETMDAYIRAGGPAPDATGSTNASGALVLDGIEEGLILVLPVGDGVHKFTSTLVALDGRASLNIAAEPKVVTPFNPTTEVKVVKHWSGDSASDRPASVKVQLVCDNEKYGDVVELSDANGWTNTWTGLDARETHQWDVMEIDAPAGYAVRITESNSTFTITNTIKTTTVTISKQEVGGGPELPGATLIVKDADGNTIEQWVSGTEPRRISLKPGTYTLTEITAPDGYEIAETITFRVNANGTTDVLQDGKWVDAANHVVMFDAPTDNPPTVPPTTVNTPPTTVTGKLPQTGQLWWPVPVLFCAGLVAIGAGRIVSTRSARATK